jgi:uncharacterized protein with HEPN domain
MSKHDDRTSLRHMLDHAREAELMIQDRSLEDLKQDRMLELALVRLIEIIGEAANRVSEDTLERFPQIPWQQIRGMHNRLIHGYDLIDLQILWDTVTDDLPALIKEIKKALEIL